MRTNINVPRICFINKLDRMGASFKKSFQSIIDRLTPNAMPIQLPVGLEADFKGVVCLLENKAFGFEGEHGEKIVEMEIPAEMAAEVAKARHDLIEKIAENEDEMMSAYLDGKELALEDLRRVLRKAVIANKIVPVLCGSALKNKGVQFMLDAVVDYLPSPADLPPVKGHDLKTGEEIFRKASDEEPFSGLAFKIATDPYVGSLGILQELFRYRKARLICFEFRQRQSGAHRPYCPYACERSRRSGRDLCRRDRGDRGP